MSKKLLLAAPVVLAVAAGFYLVYAPTNLHNDDALVNSDQLESTSYSIVMVNDEKLQQRINQLPKPTSIARSVLKRDNLMVDIPDAELTSDEMPLWQARVDVDVSRIPSSVQGTNYMGLNFSDSLDHLLGPGESVKITLPNNQDKELIINHETIHPNGDITWTGSSFDNEGNEYPVVMTYGEGGVFGSIATETEIYTIITVNKQSIIYANPPLQDDGQPDHLIPPIG